MSTDIFETAADGTGTVRAAFDATAAECRPDIDAMTRRALDRGRRVRRHRTVGKAVGSAAAAAAIGLGTAYALNESGAAARPVNIPGSGTHSGNTGPDLPDLRTPSEPTTTAAPTSTVTASMANAVATWRTAHRGTLTVLRKAAWL
ncbi:hypothetical protein [Catenulispora rubra]|uniref:hypothetical protein n=1 Tax=Catenulispora rubra TaxID=280293 RepID=UPI0018927BB0|nr:hypothetical protein [Catenulispora rubra]